MIFATTVSRAQVAGLAGVTRAAVTQWRKRHADFPASVDGDSDRFDLSDVIGWLDGRPIPASSRASDEAADATYGDRVRRRLRPAERPDADLLFRSLLALGPQVCGDAPRSDYLYLLLCLAFLRLHDQDRWVQLTRAVPPSGDPRTIAAAACSWPTLISWNASAAVSASSKVNLRLVAVGDGLGMGCVLEWLIWAPHTTLAP